MFIRIVKMSFHEEKIPIFLDHFHGVKMNIRNFSGNNFLEIYQDKSNPSIFFTYSVWNEETDWKITGILIFLKMFGHLQKRFLMISPKRGVLIN